MWEYQTRVLCDKISWQGSFAEDAAPADRCGERLLRIDAEFAEDAVKIVAAIVLYGDRSPLVTMMNDHASRQTVRQILHPLKSGRERGVGGRRVSHRSLAKAGELLRGEFSATLTEAPWRTITSMRSLCSSCDLRERSTLA